MHLRRVCGVEAEGVLGKLKTIMTYWYKAVVEKIVDRAEPL
jgi:hypothetical protein